MPLLHYNGGIKMEIKEIVKYLKENKYKFLIEKNEDIFASEGVNPFQGLE